MKNAGFVLLGLMLAGVALGAPLADNELRWTIKSAVTQLDRQGGDFASALADVGASWSTAPAADADQLLAGRFFINKDGDFRLEHAGGVILRQGSTVHYFKSAAATVNDYRLGRHKERLESYLALGFGLTGKDLNDSYLVTYIGEEKSAERRLLGLELTPKRESDRAVISKIDLWVDQASGLPARQVIAQAGGGAVLTLTYTGMARNLKLNPDLFYSNWPRGTKRVQK
jgi:outer membrane lipoprotein-sorting protein